MSKRHSAFFVQDVYVQGVTSEIKRHRKQLYVLYAATFFGAIVVLAGGLPTTSDIDAFGIKMPAGLFSQQAIAAANSGLYTYFVGVLASTTLATSMLQIVHSNLGPEPWEFYVAKYDIFMLWGSMIRPKTQGYSSPRSERFVVWLVLLSGWMALALHALVVVLASLSAWHRATASHDKLAMTLAAFSMFAVVVALLAYLVSFLVPLPYRWNGPWPPPQPATSSPTPSSNVHGGGDAASSG